MAINVQISIQMLHIFGLFLFFYHQTGGGDWKEVSSVRQNEASVLCIVLSPDSCDILTHEVGGLLAVLGVS